MFFRWGKIENARRNIMAGSPSERRNIYRRCDSVEETIEVTVNHILFHLNRVNPRVPTDITGLTIPEDAKAQISRHVQDYFERKMIHNHMIDCVFNIVESIISVFMENLIFHCYD